MEDKKSKPINLIPKPVSQAFLAGACVSSLSFVFGAPVEYFPRIALAGAGFSLFLSWQDSRYETKPKSKKKGRQIPFNSHEGRQTIDMEFSIAQGGYAVRETYFQAIVRKLLGGSRPMVAKDIEPVDKPGVLSEFIFISHYQGQDVELREKHVKLFLASAWRNRANGKGLSKRRWERNRSQRPAWFKELSPIWYFGMSVLLWDAEKYLKLQLVIRTGHQWYALAIEPRELYGCLKWFESERRK